jgi:hypothetical protein
MIPEYKRSPTHTEHYVPSLWRIVAIAALFSLVFLVLAWAVTR